MKSKLSFSQIHKVVESFYKKATIDIWIGFQFRNIHDLPSHITRVSAFWQLQLTGKTELPGEIPFKVIDVHRPMKLTTGMVDRWIVLFHETLAESKLPADEIELWKSKIELFRERLKIIQVS